MIARTRVFCRFSAVPRLGSVSEHPTLSVETICVTFPCLSCAYPRYDEHLIY
ncbi:hypothetical protein BJV77DRAFT_1050978, partial [Russula vinacea]